MSGQQQQQKRGRGRPPRTTVGRMAVGYLAAVNRNVDVSKNSEIKSIDECFGDHRPPSQQQQQSSSINTTTRTTAVVDPSMKVSNDHHQQQQQQQQQQQLSSGFDMQVGGIRVVVDKPDLNCNSSIGNEWIPTLRMTWYFNQQVNNNNTTN